MGGVLREFEAAIREGDAPSAAYGVWQGGRTRLLGAVGLTNRERGVAATPQTPYALASITKPMTATAVMILAQRGLIDLDAPLEGIQSRAGDARKATVRRVLNHTAGLPLHYRFHYADEPLPPGTFAETVRRFAKTFTPPGERHVYSNLGYGLLDDLIARASGVPYVRFMADEVFHPLGMAGASIEVPEGVAVAYAADGTPYPRYGTDHPGGSAAYASVEDLLAFAAAHLRRPEWRIMQEPTFGYGLGWSVADRSGTRVVGHTGSMGGVRTVLRLVPALDLAVAILTNGETDLPWRAADLALAAHGVLLPEPSTPVAKPLLKGRWTGRIETHAGDRALVLDFDRHIAILDGAESPLEDLAFDGDLGTDDRRPYRLHVDLTLRGSVLNGATTAITKPGGRQGDARAYWTELAPII